MASQQSVTRSEVSDKKVISRRVFMPNDVIEIRAEGGGGLICCLYASNWIDGRDMQHANLIAAAPELLAILKSALRYGVVFEDAFVRQRFVDAIAKAEQSTSTA